MRVLAVIGIALAVASCSPPSSHIKFVELRMEADGSFDLAGQHLKDEDTLKAAIRTTLAQSPGAAFDMSADRGLPYGRVAKVMTDLQAMGVVKIGVVGTDSYQN